MKKTLTEYLARLNEQPLNEFAGTGSPAGAAMVDRPDMSGFRGKGADFNFKNRTDSGHEWPYEDSAFMQYGRSMGVKGRDRGDRPGEDMSGGPPEPKYQGTWEGGPDNTSEGADWEEMQRHGSDKDRNVWKDTPDGKEWTKLNNESAFDMFETGFASKAALAKSQAREKSGHHGDEPGDPIGLKGEAMGSPGRVGPFAPMDGPQNSSARDAGPVEDENGAPITPQYLPTPVKDMSGPNNMWGGAGTIPGATGGWANMPPRPEDEDDPEKNPMKLREFFDPSPVPVEEVENPEPGYEHDQSDEDMEPDEDDGIIHSEPDSDDFAPHLGDGPSFGPSPLGGDEPPEHTGRLGGISMNLVGKSPPGGLLGAGPSGDMVGKSSAWDVLQKVVDALGKNSGGMGGPL